MKTVRCDHHRSLGRAAGHFEAHGRDLDLREAFARDPGRFEAFSLQAPEVFADLSKNLIDLATRRFLLDLARECGVEALRDAMLAGEPINTTEGRAVLHTALRAPRGAGPFSDEVHGVLDAMLAYAERVRDADAARALPMSSTSASAAATSARDGGAGARRPCRTAACACTSSATSTATTSRRCCATWMPARTLFIIASKTFTTQETMANARWRARGFGRGRARHRRHFVATTTNVAGGRGLRHRHHLRLLGLGGRALFAVERDRPADRHRHRARRTSARCWPARMRWTGTLPRRRRRPTCRCSWACWTSGTATSTAFHQPQRGALPPGPARLPAYLQQLEMESNGKRVDRTAAAALAAPARWSGASPAPTASMPTSRCCTRAPTWSRWSSSPSGHPAHGHADLHAKLLANCLAQSQALMLGKSADAGAAERAPTAAPGWTARCWRATAAFPATGRAPRSCWTR
jgi:glucose-6-phosphate isomerase